MTDPRQAARAARDRLTRTFPRCFAPPGTRKTPLKLDIHLDVLAALPRLPVADLMAGLRCYVSTPSYLQECVEGTTRIDLEGHPAGAVSAQHASYARSVLEDIKARKVAQALGRKPDPRRRAPPRRQAAE